jgi:hypothetical protein
MQRLARMLHHDFRFSEYRASKLELRIVTTRSVSKVPVLGNLEHCCDVADSSCSAA